MTAATLALPAIADFATSVRAALADLTADEIDDLTDGLEADLTERLADGDTVELGDPVAYAEELRTAAGMPHRPVRSAGASAWAELRSLPAAVAREARAFAGRHPSIAGVGSFLVTLRPLCWVFRGAAATWLVMNVFGWSVFLTLVIGVVAAVVSIQFGRGKWLPFAWMRGLLLAANIVLVVATPFAALALVNYAYYVPQSADSYSVDSTTGLTLNGNQVGNIFAYDAQGNPLSDVQLFDQDGTPLNLVSDPTLSYSTEGDGALVVPNSSVPGRLGWNVFPLAHVTGNDVADDGTLKPSATPFPAAAPFGTAKPLATSPLATSPAPAASAIASPSPTAALAPAP